MDHDPVRQFQLGIEKQLANRLTCSAGIVKRHMRALIAVNRIFNFPRRNCNPSHRAL